MHIVLLGNTGSGKTTLAKSLAERLKLPLISSGRIAREMAEADPSTDLMLRQGDLAPEMSMRQAIRTELQSEEATRGGWVMDGFPRTTEQLVCLMQWTTGMPTFIHIDVDPWTCIERLVGGPDARERVDDNADSIAKKFASFEAQTRPMIAILERGGVLYTVNGKLPTKNQLQICERILS